MFTACSPNIPLPCPAAKISAGFQSRSRLPRQGTVHVAASSVGDEIPKSFEESVSQACESVRGSLSSGKKGRGKRSRGIRRISVEVPVLDTSIPSTFLLASKLLDALEQEGRMKPTVLFCREDYVEAAREQLPSTPVGLVADAMDGRVSLSKRLLIFSPKQSEEDAVFELIDELWRGDVVLLCNAEFSDTFQTTKASFLAAFNTVYCFMPLAIRVFVINKDGALFRWQKGKGTESKWKIFLAEGKSFRQIGQTDQRPNQDQLESAFYNAAASESFITKGVQFFQSFTQPK